ncbi:MAG: sigma-70 family RNA polymerase sigma factor [Bacteroidota bacterium]
MAKNSITLEDRLRKGDKQALEAVYVQYKRTFLSFFGSRTEGNVDLEDLYQDSVIALYQNFVLKNLQLKKGSLKTYLFAIGKNKLAASFKEKYTPLRQELGFAETFFEIDETQLSIEQKKLIQGYLKLGEKCKEILRLYYYRGLTDKEIVEQTEYKDENTSKSNRSRCLKKLKTLIHGGTK